LWKSKKPKVIHAERNVNVKSFISPFTEFAVEVVGEMWNELP